MLVEVSLLYFKQVHTPLNVAIFKFIFLSLPMHILPRMNVMLFIWTLPVHLRGTSTRNNWTSQKILSTVGIETPTRHVLQVKSPPS